MAYLSEAEVEIALLDQLAALGYDSEREEDIGHGHRPGRESRTHAALRDTLLPRLISGKLRVTDADKLLETVQ